MATVASRKTTAVLTTGAKMHVVMTGWRIQVRGAARVGVLFCVVHTCTACIACVVSAHATNSAGGFVVFVWLAVAELCDNLCPMRMCTRLTCVVP